MPNGDKMKPVAYAKWLKEKYPQYKDIPDGVLVSKALQLQPALRERLDLGPVTSEFEPSKLQRAGQTSVETFGGVVEAGLGAVEKAVMFPREHPIASKVLGPTGSLGALAYHGLVAPAIDMAKQVPEALNYFGEIAKPGLVDVSPAGGAGLPVGGPEREQALKTAEERRQGLQSVLPEAGGTAAAYGTMEVAGRVVPPAARDVYMGPTVGRAMEKAGGLAGGVYGEKMTPMGEIVTRGVGALGGGVATAAVTGHFWPGYVAGAVGTKAAGRALWRAGAERVARSLTNDALMEKLRRDFNVTTRRWNDKQFEQELAANPYFREANDRHLFIEVGVEKGEKAVRFALIPSGLQSALDAAFEPRPVVGAPKEMKPRDTTVPQPSRTVPTGPEPRVTGLEPVGKPRQPGAAPQGVPEPRLTFAEATPQKLSPDEVAAVTRMFKYRAALERGYDLTPAELADLDATVRKFGPREMGGLMPQFDEEARVTTGGLPAVDTRYAKYAALLTRVLSPGDRAAERFLAYSSHGIEDINAFTDSLKRGSINGLEDLRRTQEAGQDASWVNYRESFAPANDTPVGTKGISKKIRETYSEEQMAVTPGLKSSINRIAERYGTKSHHTVGSLADRVTQLNIELRSKRLSEHEYQVRKAELDAIHPVMDTAVDAALAKLASMGVIPGGRPSEVLMRGWQARRRYGNFKEMGSTIRKAYGREVNDYAGDTGAPADHAFHDKFLGDQYTRDELIKKVFEHDAQGPTGVWRVPVEPPPGPVSVSAGGVLPSGEPAVLPKRVYYIGYKEFEFAEGTTREQRLEQLAADARTAFQDAVDRSPTGKLNAKLMGAMKDQILDIQEQLTGEAGPKYDAMSTSGLVSLSEAGTEEVLEANKRGRVKKPHSADREYRAPELVDPAHSAGQTGGLAPSSLARQMGVVGQYPAKAKAYGLSGQFFGPEQWNYVRDRMATNMRKLGGLTESSIKTRSALAATSAVSARIRFNWFVSKRLADKIADGMSKGKTYTLVDVVSAALHSKYGARGVSFHELGHKFADLALPEHVRTEAPPPEVVARLKAAGANNTLHNIDEVVAESFARYVQKNGNIPKQEVEALDRIAEFGGPRAKRVLQRGLYIALTGLLYQQLQGGNTDVLQEPQPR